MAGKLITQVHSNQAAPPGGHYAQAIGHAGLLYVSGQLPVRADGRHQPEQPFEEQARRALGNLLAILDEAGSRPEDLLKVTVYLVGVEHWPAFDQLYRQLIGSHRPARAVVPVAGLHHGYLVEIDAISRCDTT